MSKSGGWRMRTGLKQRVHRLLRACSLVALAALSACNVQNRLLYHPPAHNGAAVDLDQMSPWPSASDFRGYIGRNPGNRGTVVVFHGNVGLAATHASYISALGPLGYRVLLHEYPAYGGRDGELGETSLVADAREAIRLVAAQVQGPIYLLGISLGAGVAAAVVAQDFGAADRLSGVIMIVPWDTLASVARSKHPNLPWEWLLTDRYDSVANLGRYPGRVAVIGAQNDEVIPVTHAQALFRSLPGSKRWWLVPGRGHNDWKTAVDQDWWKEVMSFVEGRQVN